MLWHTKLIKWDLGSILLTTHPYLTKIMTKTQVLRELSKELEALKKRMEELENKLAAKLLLNNPPITNYDYQLIYDSVLVVKLCVDKTTNSYQNLLDNMPAAYTVSEDGEIIFSFYITNLKEDIGFLRSKLCLFMGQFEAESFLDAFY